jgi:pyruvate kinase
MSTRAQIVATIGPPSADVDLIKKMIEAGMDVARINFSHANHEDNGRHIDHIREAAASLGREIPIIQDLSGPRGKTDDGHAFDSEKSILTEKDLADLDFGVSKSVSYIAQSYVGNAAHILQLKEELKKRGASIPVIAKIERAEAVQSIDEIIVAADAIMVARGDLGFAIPYENVPFVEKDIIARANAAGKPVIVATEMLYSMIHNTRPSRAEVTDIAFAILSGTDAIMLSDETAHGEHPLEAVTAMKRIALRAEMEMQKDRLHL